MFLTALSVITLVNIPLSHHAPCISIMFSSSIFSKLNSLKYSKSIMNVLRIVYTFRYVPSQRMKKKCYQTLKVCVMYLHTYLHRTLWSSPKCNFEFIFCSLSLSPQNPILPSCQQTSSSKVSHIAYADIYVRMLLLLLLLLLHTRT